MPRESLGLVHVVVRSQVHQERLVSSPHGFLSTPDRSARWIQDGEAFER